MINQELLEYINKKVSEGATKESLISELTTGGWTEADIDEALKVPSVIKNKNNDGLFNFITGIFVSIVLFFIALYTVGILAEDNPIWEKVLMSIIAFIVTPTIFWKAKKKIRKNKEQIIKDPKKMIAAYKPMGITNRLAYSIFVFIGLWFLFGFLNFAFFYHDRKPTPTENSLSILMFIPVIVIPIYAFFKKK